jgi:hypothetical protein
MRCEVLEWIELARVRAQWHSFVNTTKNVVFDESEKCLDQLSIYRLSKKDPALRTCLVIIWCLLRFTIG